MKHRILAVVTILPSWHLLLPINALNLPQQNHLRLTASTMTFQSRTHHLASPNDTIEPSIQRTEEKEEKFPSSRETRRTVLSKLSTMAIISTTSVTTTAATVLFPEAANAAPTLTAETADSGWARLERSRREKPPKLLRPALVQDFAVLLMRSSYNAMDQIDCVPMDQFQKDFYFIRSTEYLPYVTALGPGLIQQGNLTDPYYFDFISFAQYSTISRDATDHPQSIFEEQYGIEENGPDNPQTFVTRVVRRDPSVTDDDLPALHSDIVGAAILDKLEETFGGTSSALPSLGTRPDADAVLAALQQLVNLFLLNGFAFSGKVGMKSAPSPSSNNGVLGMGEGGEGGGGGAKGVVYEIRFVAPATLWGGKAMRKAKIRNDFVMKCARVMLRRAGYGVQKESVTFTNDSEVTTFTVV